MFKLIFIELKKIFLKKSIYVIMVIMLLFNILNNVLFYTDYDEDGNYKYLETTNLNYDKKILEKQILSYDYTKANEASIYINLKTKLDLIKIQEKYQYNSWQYNKINDYLYNILESINIYTFKIKDDELLRKYKQELEELLIKFDTDDWRYFVNLEIENIKEENRKLKEQLTLGLNEEENEKIGLLIKSNEEVLQILRYRIVNNIKEDSSYLNIALNNCYNNALLIKDYEEVDKLTNDEKREYQSIKSQFEENKYVLENKINYNKQNDLNYQLRTIVEDYEIFIIILILIVASTSMAEEFVSGTIKLLLIKPYSRGKILLSKYLATFITLLVIIGYLIMLQLIIGGIIFGFSSLDIPVIIYDFNKECIVEYNVFIYMIIRIIAKIPMLLMILTISFSMSTIINNVSLAITMPLFLYIFTPSISYLLLQYKINSLKYFIGLNWSFSDYLFGKIGNIEGINFKNSLFIWSSYYILIIIFTYFCFKKKNIKNV